MTEVNQVLCRNIKRARKRAQITQEKMAELLDISQIHYGRLERGERRASLKQIEEIALVLSISPYALLEGCFENLIRPDFEDEESEEIVTQLTPLLRSCNSKERALCFDICRRIAWRE